MNPILTAAYLLESAQSEFEMVLSTDTGEVTKERYRELERAVTDAMYKVIEAVREEKNGK